MSNILYSYVMENTANRIHIILNPYEIRSAKSYTLLTNYDYDTRQQLPSQTRGGSGKIFNVI